MNTSIRKLFIIGLSTTTLLGLSFVVAADIYQWRDDSGGIQFGNNPPNGNSTVKLISKQRSYSKSSKKTSIASIRSSKQATKIKKSGNTIFRDSRRTNLLYQGEIAGEVDSRIISVRLLKENKNTLIFDVNYYLSTKLNGTASIGIVPNMNNWSSIYTKAHPGRHATTVTVKLADEARTDVRSTSLKLSIAIANKQTYGGKLFEHDLSFNKVWYKR